jgi:outer membrane receptor protein involved in Fe transport
MERDATTVEEVVVTGSYIRRAVQDSPTPVSIVGQEEFDTQALQVPEDLLRVLPINSGSANAPDTTGGAYTVGTAQVNLRGLGLASTLTLINGRRQTVSPIPNDDGSSFVDINTIPLIMVERLEVLQSGAAALYGSDAVAGVANFIMRRRMEGTEVRASYQATTEEGQAEYSLGAVSGWNNDRVNVVAGLEWFQRRPLDMSARPFTNGKIRSGLGFPGAFAPAGSLPIIDRNCAAGGGIPTPFGVPGRPDIGLCGIDLTKDFDLISEERRLTGYATMNADMGSGVSLYGELGIASNEADVTSSQFSNLKFPTVPANNPGNLVANGGFGVPVTYYGRPLGGNPVQQSRSSEMFRGVLGVRGPLQSGWTYDLSYAHSQQLFEVRGVTDTKGDRFQAALNCRGGPNNNLCFNPFGSSVLNPALANSPEVIRDFITDSWRDYRATLNAVDFVTTGDLFTLPAGEVGVAFGGQVRHEKLSFQSDIDAQTGNLVFIFTGPDFSQSRWVGALFAEAAVPLHSTLEAQLAARYETYSDDLGSSFDPKLALRWEPTRGVVVRGSVGTSFRAPSISQTSSISTINEAIADPLNPTPIPFFRAVVTVPAELEPEQAVNYNLGFVLNPFQGLSFAVDYWRYDYTDIIVKQNAQALVNANPNAPFVIRPLGARGPISQVLVSFVNATEVLTDGYDFTGTFARDLGPADLSFTARSSYINQYTTNLGRGDEDLAGFRNFQNFARSLPKWRTNLSATYDLGAHAFSTNVNYISSYKENLANPADPLNGFVIDAFTSVDFQYNLQLEAYGAELWVGLINAFDEYPPSTRAPGDLQGFDRLVHDPRGRMAYIRMAKRF